MKKLKHDKQWKPGEAPYATWLKTLTTEEKAQHLLDRKSAKMARRAFGESMEELKAQYHNEITASMWNAFVAVTKRAELEGDVPAFNAVWEKVYGKAGTSIDITSNGQTLQAPTIVFTPVVLDEWKDED